MRRHVLRQHVLSPLICTSTPLSQPPLRVSRQVHPLLIDFLALVLIPLVLLVPSEGPFGRVFANMKRRIQLDWKGKKHDSSAMMVRGKKRKERANSEPCGNSWMMIVSVVMLTCLLNAW